MFDFLSNKHWFVLGSIVVIIAGIISIFLPGGLNLGIEFREGSDIEFQFQEQVSLAQFRSAISDFGYEGALVKELDNSHFSMRTEVLSAEEENKLKNDLEERLGAFNVTASGTITDVIAQRMIRHAAIAVAVAAAAILLYITWAFRRMPSPFRYGTCAIIALLHDILVVLGIFSLLGRAFNLEVDPMFVTACLAVIGYSVNNTIVVFDRVRENLLKGISRDFKVVVNYSIAQTLARSLNTSLTTILVVVAIYLFVGGTIQNFILALLIGIIAGTYSSIFIASQLLVIWEEGNWKRYIPSLPLLKRARA